MRLTPQTAFTIRNLASMLRQYHEEPNTQMDGGFTLRRVLRETGEWLNMDVSGFKPGSNGLLVIAARLDELEREAMAAPPMTSAEVLAFLKPRKRR